jgi:hypothetical protein
MPDVFVNYRTHDAEDVAVTIENDLSHRFGSGRIFRASKSLEPGENYPQALLRNARTCRVLVAVIGPHWLDQASDGRNRLEDTEDWVRREILAAFEAGACVIPVIVGRTTPRLSEEQLPEALKEFAQCHSIRYDYQNAPESLEKLSRSILARVPELAERAASTSGAADSRVTDRDDVSNAVRGQSTVNGPVTQARDISSIQHGGIGQMHGGSATFIGRAAGPMHTGSGNQYNRFSPAESETGDGDE